jgi:hypothetical protein
MRAIVWNESDELLHHEDMLMVRLHPTGERSARRHGESPALKALARAEAAGQLHAVHALDGGPVGGRSARLRPALVRARRHHHPQRPHTGTLLLHATHRRHIARLHAAFATDPQVEWVHQVPARHLGVYDDAAMPALRGWHQEAIRLREARALEAFREPRRIRVAVLDTGVDRGHPALRDRVCRYLHRLTPTRETPDDIVGHGTHVAGIIAAADTELGVHGMCRCDLTVYKIFGGETFLVHDQGRSYRLFLVDPVAYRAALQRCLDTPTDVINLSLGGTAPPDPHERALVAALIASGRVIVAAMGNSSTHRTRRSYPAALPGVIAVGAVGQDGRSAPFSCTGRHITCCAPGMDIWSTLPRAQGAFGFPATRSGRRTAGANPLARNVRYDAWPGTSMACPQVTAAVAMLLATRGPLSPQQVRQRLLRTATRLAAMRGRRFDSTYGAGRLDVARLLAAPDR